MGAQTLSERARARRDAIALRVRFLTFLALFACRTPPAATEPARASDDAGPVNELANDAGGGRGSDDATPPPNASQRLDAGANRDAGAPAQESESVPEEMALVPAGTFRMGSEKGGEEDERPAHEVTLPAFLLDRTEVTNEAYDRCVAAGKCSSPDRGLPERNGNAPRAAFFAPKKPVVAVTFADAERYCAFVGKRLPKEAEFERAVRGDDGRKFPWGNDSPTPNRTVFGRDLKTGSPDEVGTHPEGRGPYGHDDLAGNVWEWMADDYDPYAYRRAGAGRGEPGTCPEIMKTQDELRSLGLQGFTGSNPIPNTCEKVLRGGAFNYDAFGLRASNRVHHPGTFHLVMSGFRGAKSIVRPGRD